MAAAARHASFSRLHGGQAPAARAAHLWRDGGVVSRPHTDRADPGRALRARDRTGGAFGEAITEAFEDGAPELVVCGGASVYRAALPYADELCLTLIDAEVEGEAVFPDYEAEIEWEKLSEESHPADAENAHPMTFVRLRRIRPSSLRPSRLHLL